jgi:hypothetical protein
MNPKQIFFGYHHPNPMFEGYLGRNNKIGDVSIYMSDIYDISTNFDEFVKKMIHVIDTEVFCSCAKDFGFMCHEPCPIVKALKSMM